MKKLILLFITSIISCSTVEEKSVMEIKIEKNKEIVMEAYNAQMSGDIDKWKSLISEDWTFILTGQLDISKTYDWNEFLSFSEYFGSLLKGEIGSEFESILVGENEAMIFLKGKMEGVGGKYENDYAIRYILNNEGKITSQKEWLSDILLSTQLYGQEVCGEKRTL